MDAAQCALFMQFNLWHTTHLQTKALQKLGSWPSLGGKSLIDVHRERTRHRQLDEVFEFALCLKQEPSEGMNYYWSTQLTNTFEPKAEMRDEMTGHIL